MIELICIQSSHMITLLGNPTPLLRRTVAQYSSVLQIDSTTSVPSAGWRTSIGYRQRAIPWAHTPCNLILGLSIFCMALVKTPCFTLGRHHLLWSIPSWDARCLTSTPITNLHSNWACRKWSFTSPTPFFPGLYVQEKCVTASQWVAVLARSVIWQVYINLESDNLTCSGNIHSSK